MHQNKITIKVEGLLRMLMVHLLPGVLPLYIVTEYPKSGGSWLAQILSEYFNVPFPRNRFPKLQSSVIHGHYNYHPLMKNVFVVLRDGRDIMVSFYFQSLLKNDRLNSQLVELTRKELRFDDYDDVKNNLPMFIEYKFIRKRHPIFTWSDFVNKWSDKKATFIRYESLLEDTEKEMTRALSEFSSAPVDGNVLKRAIEKYSFKNQANRNPGEEDRSSFLRKGIAGDWKNYFSKEACEVFNKYAGRELIKLGYETDDGWIDEV